MEPATEPLSQLLATDVEKRDETWEKNLLRELPNARLTVLSPEPQQGPDGWPYLFVGNGGSNAPQGSDSALDVLSWLSTRGIGLALNPQKPMPDYVLTYGMVWNFRERGELVTKAAMRSPGPLSIEDGQRLFTGAPTESYLPGYARSILKQFLLDQGVLAPRVLMVSFDGKDFDLCFSIESLNSPPASEHQGIAEALSWFLPAHYSVALVSEKTVPGFQAL